MFIDCLFLTEMLRSEDMYIQAIKERVEKAGEKLTPSAEHDLRLGFRTEKLIEYGLAEKAAKQV